MSLFIVLLKSELKSLLSHMVINVRHIGLTVSRGADRRPSAREKSSRSEFGKKSHTRHLFTLNRGRRVAASSGGFGFVLPRQSTEPSSDRRERYILGVCRRYRRFRDSLGFRDRSTATSTGSVESISLLGPMRAAACRAVLWLGGSHLKQGVGMLGQLAVGRKTRHPTYLILGGLEF